MPTAQPSGEKRNPMGPRAKSVGSERIPGIQAPPESQHAKPLLPPTLYRKRMLVSLQPPAPLTF